MGTLSIDTAVYKVDAYKFTTFCQETLYIMDLWSGVRVQRSLERVAVRGHSLACPEISECGLGGERIIG